MRQKGGQTCVPQANGSTLCSVAEGTQVPIDPRTIDKYNENYELFKRDLELYKKYKTTKYISFPLTPDKIREEDQSKKELMKNKAYFEAFILYDNYYKQFDNTELQQQLQSCDYSSIPEFNDDPFYKAWAETNFPGIFDTCSRIDPFFGGRRKTRKTRKRKTRKVKKSKSKRSKRSK